MERIFFLVVVAIIAVSASHKDVCLSSHNKLRALHLNTPAMVWDYGLAAAAKKWADHLARKRLFQHDSNRGKGIGENIYYGTGPKPRSCAEAIYSWYNEYKDYNYNNPLRGSTGVIGHFTQIVWKSSLKVGVGIGTATKNGNTVTYIVARYSPAGNLYTNEAYRKNVLRLRNGAVVPTLFELDPSLCSDASGTTTCRDYKKWGYCKPGNKYYKHMESLCAKTCGFC